MDTSNVVSKVANRMVTAWLGGWRQAIASETLAKESLDTIWDDRVLNRSYALFGGVPTIVLESANNVFPEALKKRLGRMTVFESL